MSKLKSMVIAFSMYSKIPMPKLMWKDEDMKYSLFFFPFIGVVIALILYGWWRLCSFLNFGPFLFAGVATYIPILITGGIHMDGFLDTTDARSSYQSKERKLEILKDPHCGAFAIIGGVIYFLLYFAVVTEIKEEIAVIMMGSIFVLTRILSALALVWFRSAKKDGLLYAFSSTAHKTAMRISLFVLLIACMVFMYVLWDVKGLILAGIAFLVFVYYRRISYKEFGGITGDLAGYFLQLSELLMLMGIVVLERVSI